MRATVEYETPKPPIDNAPIQVIDPVMNTQSSQLGFIIPDEIDPSVSVYSAQHANRYILTTYTNQRISFYSITNQSAPIKIIISQGSEGICSVYRFLKTLVRLDHQNFGCRRRYSSQSYEQDMAVHVHHR